MSTPQTATIGNGTAIHVAYHVGERLVGSACNPFAWERSRVRYSDRPATCPRCAKAVHRLAEGTSQGRTLPR